MKFNHLNVPTHWRTYWSRYPEGHTILEALISWVSQVDSMVDNQNKLNDNVEQFRNEIDVFVERFDDRLQDEVTQTLNDWQTSGFLDVVISEALQWQLDDYIATNEADKLSLITQVQQNEQEFDTRLSDMVVSVKEFGAVGDGVTDDTQAIIQTRDYIRANGGVFFIPETFNCLVTESIDLTLIYTFKIDGVITGNDLNNTITIGLWSQNNQTIKAYVNRISGITLKIVAVRTGDITLNHMDRVLLWADKDIPEISSLAYSNFYLGFIKDLEINGSGWINENKFYGGHLMKLTIEGSYTHNHNYFYTPTLEGSTSEINILRGSSNVIFGARLENNPTITFGVEAWDNIIIRSWHGAPKGYLYGSYHSDYTDNGRNNIVTNLFDAFFDEKQLYHLSANSHNYNTSFLKREKNQLTSTFSSLYKPVVETDFIEITNDFGVIASSDKAMWRMYVEFYDENKIKFTTNPIDSWYSAQFTWYPASGWISSSVNTKGMNLSLLSGGQAKYVKFSVRPQVEMAFEYLNVIVKHNKIAKSRFQLLNEYTYLRDSKTPEHIGTVGEIVYNTVPTSGGVVGWVYTADGWKNFGTIS